MKLVKSLLLSSAAGISAVAGAQAADLPFRKAAPVEYVRVCDYTGAGYFYIPGSDTCLKLDGYAQMNFAYIDPQRTLVPGVSGIGLVGDRTASFIIASQNRNSIGFKAEGRLEADARTQTAYGTLRTLVRFQADAGGGLYAQNLSGSSVTAPSLAAGTTSTAYIDKAFVQFAGITAGRAQSMFDFYADNYNYESIANADASTEMFAYTATFGGGFSATIAAEEGTNRRNGIRNTNDNFTSFATGTFGASNVAYAGEEIPDFVGNIRLDQAWGAAQLSAAYHQVRIGNTFTNGSGVAGSGFQDLTRDGFAVQGGIQIKLPMLAAGDDLWLQGAYQNGAYLYQDTAGGINLGFNGLFAGGFLHQDADAIAFANANGSRTISLSEGFSVAGAFHHYFTPTFSDVLFGSYQEVSYGNRSRNTDWTLGGLGDASSYRIGNQFLWTPVNNFVVGLEITYTQVNQTLAHNPNAAATSLAGLGIDKDPSNFEGRIRVERDF